MNKQFQTAEELMDYLKQQIVRYSNDEDYEFEESAIVSSVSYSTSSIDMSRLASERDANNVLWNVSAERPITSHRKVAGKFIVFTKKIIRKMLRWYVSQTFELQSAFNGSVTRSINEITNTLQTIVAKMEQLDSKSLGQELLLKQYEHLTYQQSLKINELESQIEDIRILVHGSKDDDIKGAVDSLKHNMLETIQQMDNSIQSIKSDSGLIVNGINQSIQLNAARLDEINKSLNVVQDQFKSETNFLNYRIRKILKAGIESKHINHQKEDNIVIPIEETVSGGFDYLHFENKFRGSLDEIKNRQRTYLPYFEGSNNVLDIGCGRGEFIELMIENNVSVTGIDLNDDMVEYCQDRGLPVQKNDAVTYLYSVENASLGGIFLGQVIEHMPFDQIIMLVELAYKKLKPGSYLIMETPNPLSLAIFYRTFYVDPTHVKPVHPLTIQYVVESAGFLNTELKYSSSVEPNWWLPKLEGDSSSIQNIEEFNHGVERINNLLYGNLDYAIIARK
jgi:O-antigen chain-terminating methyltransferase